MLNFGPQNSWIYDFKSIKLEKQTRSNSNFILINNMVVYHRAKCGQCCFVILIIIVKYRSMEVLFRPTDFDHFFGGQYLIHFQTDFHQFFFARGGKYNLNSGCADFQQNFLVRFNLKLGSSYQKNQQIDFYQLY